MRKFRPFESAEVRLVSDSPGLPYFRYWKWAPCLASCAGRDSSELSVKPTSFSQRLPLSLFEAESSKYRMSTRLRAKCYWESKFILMRRGRRSPCCIGSKYNSPIQSRDAAGSKEGLSNCPPHNPLRGKSRIMTQCKIKGIGVTSCVKFYWLWSVWCLFNSNYTDSISQEKPVVIENFCLMIFSSLNKYLICISLYAHRLWLCVTSHTPAIHQPGVRWMSFREQWWMMN